MPNETKIALDGRPIYSVSALSHEVRRLLEASYASILVEGEVSGLKRPASGHQYFTLKDENAQLRCAFFRNRARLSDCQLADGKHVIATVGISLYEARGDFQLIVQSVMDAGEGLLRRRFEELKRKLAAEGLFATDRKQPLPRLPRRVGLITSPSGAAVHDLITTFRRRYAGIPLLIYPTAVQGDNAAAEIASAIRLADQRRDCDVIVLARGGGSLEDLWPFNEEVLARAIAGCQLPLVSAVGHETDFTIADLVADARAPTPTAAAELLSPDTRELQKHLTTVKRRLFKSIDTRLLMSAQRVDGLASRLPAPARLLEQARRELTEQHRRLHSQLLFGIERRHYALQQLTARLQRPDSSLRLFEQRVAHAGRRLHGTLRNLLGDRQQSLEWQQQRLLRSMPQQLQFRHAQLARSSQTLHALSPLQTLARGYATLQNMTTDKTLYSVDDVRPGDPVRATLVDGHIDCRIEEIIRIDQRENPDQDS
jgi:exodeoxyribonuclease VII large subunit